MRGVVVYCPDQECGKPFLRNAKLKVGITFEARCFFCGTITCINVTPEGIKRLPQNYDLGPNGENVKRADEDKDDDSAYTAFSS